MICCKTEDINRDDVARIEVEVAGVNFLFSFLVVVVVVEMLLTNSQNNIANIE